MSQPVFVLAPPRSFSSVVAAMIGQHPQLYGLPELHLFTSDTVGELYAYYGMEGERSGRRADGLLRVLAELFCGEQSERNVFISKKWLSRNQAVTTIALLQRIMERVSPRDIVEKSITTCWNDANLQRVIDGFPTARFIHLLRHPRSHGRSLMKLVEERNWHVPRGILDHTTDPPTMDPQLMWLRIHGRIARMLAALPEGRHLRVRGEDVLSEPDRELARIVEWLGLRTDAEAVEAMKHPEQSPYASPGPRNAMFGADQNFIANPHFRPGRVEAQSLDGPLDWREDRAGFRDPVKRLATGFGYR